MSLAGRVTALAGLARHRSLEALHPRGLGGPTVYVSEFPKSGGTWVKEMTRDLLASSENAAASPDGRVPAVLHQHWPYAPSLRPAIYVLRDGRDVAVSLYFHVIRHLRTDTLFSRRARAFCDDVFGPDADPMDTRRNLPAFIRSLSTHPFAIIVRTRRDHRFQTWPRHVRDWTRRRGVTVVRYERLLTDTPTEIRRIGTAIGHPISPATSQDITRRHSFERKTGRTPGTENPVAFRRKGIAGDWRNHFTAAAAQAFLEFGGETLIAMGYEQDDRWARAL